MPSEEKTVFQKIIDREIPAHIVYEDHETIAFLDAAPRNAGHTLVVPKKLFRNIFDIDDETFTSVMRVARKLAPAILSATKSDGMNVAINNEAAAGQIVFHFHVHLIPRLGEDYFPHKGKYDEGEAEEIAEKIRAAIAQG